MVNKEQLLYFFLKGNIRLSGYDMRFMSNLQNMIHRDKMVTSNQARLFDALIYKYKKQLGKNNLNSDELKELDWRSKVVESSPEFTGARVDCVDGGLNLRVPFNKHFVNDFADVNNPFVWYKEEKMYKAGFSTSALKLLYDQLPKYFKTVIYSPVLHSLIEEIEKYNKLVWDPTVVKINGNYIIAGANEYLLDAIKHIDLNDLNTDNDINVAFELSKHQIKINPPLLKDRKDLNFASTFRIEVDIKDIQDVAKWLNTMGIQKVVTTDTSLNERLLKQSHEDTEGLVSYDVINAFATYDIEIKHLKNSKERVFDDSMVFVSFTSLSKKILNISSVTRSLDKIIKINNSRPVNLS